MQKNVRLYQVIENQQVNKSKPKSGIQHEIKVAKSPNKGWKKLAESGRSAKVMGDGNCLVCESCQLQLL